MSPLTLKAVAFLMLMVACTAAEPTILKDEGQCEGPEWNLSYATAGDALDYNSWPDNFQVMADVQSSNTLLRAHESPLTATASPSATTIRLTWVPSFTPPVVVRLDKTDAGIRFSAAELAWGSADYHSQARFMTAGDLPPESWEFIADKLAQEHFWSLPCFKPDEAILDGALMFFEMAGKDGAHCVARYKVWEYPLLRAAATCLLKWSTPSYNEVNPLKECPRPPEERICILE